MIPLGAGEIPTTGVEFANRVQAALGAMIQAKGGALPKVECSMTSPEKIDSVVIDLSNLESGAARVQKPASFTTLGDTIVKVFSLGGRPIILHGAPVHLDTDGNNLPMSWVRDDHGNLWLTPSQRETEEGKPSGKMDVSAGIVQVEAALREAIGAMAEAQGAKLKDLTLQIDSSGPRSLLIKADVAAAKFMMTAKLQAIAEAVLDDNMNLRINQLDVKGDGAAGTMVANMFGDKVTAIRGREIALGDFMFAGAALEDIHVEVDDKVRLVAKFG